MSKIVTNKIELSPAVFIFEEMLKQAVDAVSFLTDEKQQKLSVKIDHAIPKVFFADDHRLQQVIANLLGNAIRFTPDEGEVCLRARLLSEQGDVCTIEVAVSATGIGIGISQVQQSMLFQVFQQAESSTTQKFGGIGLDLAVAKSIMESMGGKIWIESEMCKGTKIAFTVEMKQAENLNCGLVHPEIDWGNIRVLIVDEDVDAFYIYADVISGLGADFDVSVDAASALRHIKDNGCYDVCFIDQGLPAEDRIHLTREIMSSEEKDVSSVVYTTTSASLGRLEDDKKDFGINKLLRKPLFPSAIVNMLSACVGHCE